MNDEPLTFLEHVFINLSKRSIKILDNEGFDRVVDFDFNKKGAKDFTDAVSEITELVDSDMITYFFAETE